MTPPLPETTEVIRIAGTAYARNSRGVIDVSDRYYTTEYMRPNITTWTLDTADVPVTAIILHHWAGWYGSPLAGSAEPEEELARLDLLAAHHVSTYGIGPAYNLVVFPGSGRVYAVGKHGTHRAHTAGRRPAAPSQGLTGRPYWNVAGRAIAVAGDWEANLVPGTNMLDSIYTAVEEIRSWPNVSSRATVEYHGKIETVNRAGDIFRQTTLCPGKHLVETFSDYLHAQRPMVPTALDEIERRASEADRVQGGVLLGEVQEELDRLEERSALMADKLATARQLLA